MLKRGWQHHGRPVIELHQELPAQYQDYMIALKRPTLPINQNAPEHM